jgi:hypothetical protein
MKKEPTKPSAPTVVRWQVADSGAVTKDVPLAEVLMRTFEQGALYRHHVELRFAAEFEKVERLRTQRLSKAFVSDAAMQTYEQRMQRRVAEIALKRAVALHPSDEARKERVQKLQAIVDLAFQRGFVHPAKSGAAGAQVRKTAGELTRRDFGIALDAALKICARDSAARLTAKLVLRNWPRKRAPGEHRVQELLKAWRDSQEKPTKP